MVANERLRKGGRNPFEGLPGFRAAYYRLLYRFVTFLDDGMDSREMADSSEQDRERQRRWDQDCSSPPANFAATVVVLLVVVLAVNVTLWSMSARHRTVSSGSVLPSQRVHSPIRPA